MWSQYFMNRRKYPIYYKAKIESEEFSDILIAYEI